MSDHLREAAEDWRDEAIAALELARELAENHRDHATVADCDRVLAQWRDTPADQRPGLSDAAKPL